MTELATTPSDRHLGDIIASCHVHAQELADNHTASAYYACRHCGVACHQGQLNKMSCEPETLPCTKPPGMKGWVYVIAIYYY